MLPLAGFIPHATSIALALTVMITLFYESPRAKAMEDFREKLYRRIREIRGREIAMIFQEPMTSLNPVYTVGLQIIEALKPKSVFDFLRDAVISGANSIRTSTFASKLRVVALFGGVILFFSQLFQGWTFQSSAMVSAFATGALIPGVFWGSVLLLDRLIPKAYHQQYETLFAEGVQLLRAVGISDPEKRMRDYPHQFSGGMRQRAMIAMALAKHPSLLIADEPTTALDVTIQAQILELMLEIKNKQNDSAVVLITHDLAVVAETCERVMVMYGGKIQEVAAVNTLFEAPKHPYTKGLLHSIPRPTQEKRERLETIRGMVPSILNFPAGCKFCTRCDEKLEKCETIEPDLLEVEPGHFVRCHLFSEVKS
ncbi:MAG: ABC transporter ATP-binding protein [Gemmatimonadetes bacterium]|nr:MAG: ABC transporter ATP-binding protein [Gemmatimonadota bacterium]